jgi:hypothetical protein
MEVIYRIQAQVQEVQAIHTQLMYLDSQYDSARVTFVMTIMDNTTLITMRDNLHIAYSKERSILMSKLAELQKSP